MANPGVLGDAGVGPVTAGLRRQPCCPAAVRGPGPLRPGQSSILPFVFRPSGAWQSALKPLNLATVLLTYLNLLEPGYRHKTDVTRFAPIFGWVAVLRFGVGLRCGLPHHLEATDGPGFAGDTH